MRRGLDLASHLCVILCLFPVLLHGLDIPDSEEVQYVRAKTKGMAGQSVTLECGFALPDVYIWGYTAPGASSSRAVLYDYGQGPKIQHLAENLGHLSVIPKTSTLVIHQLQNAAEGLYTCQALCYTAEGTRVTFYFVELDVLDEAEEYEESH